VSLLLAIAAVLACATWFAVGWGLCALHHRALRTDRDLHEQDAHIRGDRAWALTGRIDRWIDNPNRAWFALQRAHRVRHRTEARS
jgi:hypothetical protein